MARPSRNNYGPFSIFAHSPNTRFWFFGSPLKHAALCFGIGMLMYSPAEVERYRDTGRTWFDNAILVAAGSWENSKLWLGNRIPETWIKDLPRDPPLVDLVPVPDEKKWGDVWSLGSKRPRPARAADATGSSR
jgi:hypothetical protein